MNADLQDGDVISGIGLINSHTLYQVNESSNLSEMNLVVENGDVSGVHCYINSDTLYEATNHNSVSYKNKRDEMFPMYLK